MEHIGTFNCSDETLNKIIRNAFWGIRSNYKGMPVDCPQRNERQPWLGDRTMGCWGESMLFDNYAMYTKWTRDIREAQREDGCIPDVAPGILELLLGQCDLACRFTNGLRHAFHKLWR